MKNLEEALVQRQYYASTAERYDQMHGDQEEEHFMALSLLLGSIDRFGWETVLDVGAGTGRGLNFIRRKQPHLHVVGVEPISELREQGYQAGIPKDILIDGDATALQFADGEFDVVCEFAVLHHIKCPERAVSEMLRVAKHAIFISDSNNFGQGSFPLRACKQTAHALGLWKLVNLIQTRGKGYTMSEADGLAYSYSVFNNYKQIKEQCKSVHILNTMDAGINPYRTAGHVALLGLKRP